jgi:hypothetical protein
MTAVQFRLSRSRCDGPAGRRLPAPCPPSAPRRQPSPLPAAAAPLYLQPSRTSTAFRQEHRLRQIDAERRGASPGPRQSPPVPDILGPF